jgi:hypothetical protein
MNCRSVLLVSAFLVGLSTIGCTSGSSVRSSPSAPSTEGNASSSEGATRPPQPPPPSPPPATGTCVADRAQWAVGRTASAPLLERARVDATASIARFIRPDDAITMEFSPARLNVYLDERDVVRGVVCG